MSDYWRVYCTTDEIFYYEFNTVAPTLCPFHGDAAINMASIKELTIDYLTKDHSFNDVESANDFWTAVHGFEFAGLDVYKNVPKIEAVATIPGGTYSLRIYDYTNVALIGTSAVQSNPDEQLIDIGTLTGLPATSAWFELQVKRESGADTITASFVKVTYYEALPV